MAGDGEVDVIRTPDGEAVYRSCSTDHHHHVVCRSCGLAVEVTGDAVERWAEAAGRPRTASPRCGTPSRWTGCAPELLGRALHPSPNS